MDAPVQYTIQPHHTLSTPLPPSRRKSIQATDFGRYLPSPPPMSPPPLSSSIRPSPASPTRPIAPPAPFFYPSSSRQRLALYVCLSSDESDRRELIVDPEQQSFEGINYCPFASLAPLSPLSLSPSLPPLPPLPSLPSLSLSLSLSARPSRLHRSESSIHKRGLSRTILFEHGNLQDPAS